MQWSKRRALAYLDAGEPLREVVASMGSDLHKHPETENNPAITLGVALLVLNATRAEIRRWVEGFAE